MRVFQWLGVWWEYHYQQGTAHHPADGRLDPADMVDMDTVALVKLQEFGIAGQVNEREG